MKDLKLFLEILYDRVPIELPEYLGFYHGASRLRSSHLDDLSIVSTIQSRLTRNYNDQQGDVTASSLSQFSNSYFMRTMNNWNALPRTIQYSGDN